MDSVLEAADCFGVPAVLNYDDAQLDVCSSSNTALSSQHSNVKLNNLLESAAFPWLHIQSVQCVARAQCSCGSSLVLGLCK